MVIERIIGNTHANKDNHFFSTSVLNDAPYAPTRPRAHAPDAPHAP